MASFTYDGLNKQGQNVHGEVVADNSSIAMEKLREAGVIVTDIKEKQINERKKARGKKVKIEDVAIFARQMAAMMSAGVPVTRSLATLAKQTSNATLANAIDEIRENVEGGMPLSEAFAQYPKIFNDLFVAMIASGEVGGILEQTLNSLANQLQKQKALQDNIKSAISYPRSIGIFALVLLHAMLAFMVPVFKNMIPETTEINGLTQFIFNASDVLRTRWYLWFGTIIAVVVAIYFIAKSPPMHKLWEQHKLHAPLIGELMTKQTIARFCRTLATLLAGGVTAVEALKSAGPTSGSDLIAKAVEDAIQDIEEGKAISDSLDKSGLFPPMVTGMIAIGEEAGTLPELLDKVAEFFEEDVETLSRNLKAMVEPLALVGIGGLVGAMIIALYLPIFTASTSVEGY